MAKRNFKTVRKLTMQKVYRAWDMWKPGELVIGKIVGTHTDQYDKENYVVEVLEAEFESSKEAKEVVGKNLVLNAAGGLNKSLENLEIGDTVQVVYKGMGKIEKGKYKGKDAHTFEVDQVVEEGSEPEITGEEETNEDGW